MDVTILLSYPFLALYIFVIFFTLLLPPLYVKRKKLLLTSLLFALTSSLIILYAFTFPGEEQLILVASSAIVWLFPLIKLNESILSTKSVLKVNLDKEVLKKSVKNGLKRKKWSIFCYNKVMNRFKVSSNFFESKLNVEAPYVELETNITKGTNNILDVVSTILVATTTFIFYSNALETDVVKISSSLTIVSVLALILFGLTFNLMGFIENQNNEIKALIYREIKELEEAAELARAIAIAAKIKSKAVEKGESEENKKDNEGNQGD